MNHSDQIKSKLDIVDVLSSYLSLKPAGSNFRAICPFHNEKTPSLMVSPEKQIWHCFGCGKGGDIFSFIMEIEGLDFVETLKLLAPRAGVVLDSKDFSQDKNKNKSLEIMDLSRKYYNFILNSEKSDNNKKVLEIRDYLKKRGLDKEAINRWGIGYSHESFNDLLDFLKSKKFTELDVVSSGMAIKNDRGKCYNRFRDRIMFPINDVNGRTVAFTARINPFVLNPDKAMGKYINSPQTSLYDKSRILFALDKAKTAIREKSYVIVVEGQMDAISAHEAGFDNTVASSGTALTEGQLMLLKRYTENIYLSFDQDLAGVAATDRGIMEALKMGFNIKIIDFADNSSKDPDDLIREDPGLFKKYIDNAKNIIDHYLTKESKSIDMTDIVAKNKSVHKILTVINMLNNKVEQDFWIKELTQRYGLDETFLREDLSKIVKNSNKNSTFVKEGEKDENKENINPDYSISREDKLAELLLAISFRFPQNFDYIVNNLDLEFFPVKYKDIYSELIDCYNKNSKNLDYNDFLDYIKSSDSELIMRLDDLNRVGLLADFYLSEIGNDNLDEVIKKELINLIIEIKRNYYKKNINKKNEELLKAEKNNDKDLMNDILNDIKTYSEKLKRIE
jgi:DNA primase